MKNFAQYIICSNRWFSAVTEYALQLALFLENEGYQVQVLAHERSPLLGKAIEKKILCRSMHLQSKSLVEWLLSAAALLNFLWSLPKERLSVLWVVEGHEHTLCALMRFCFPHIRKRSLLVRLRGQDRFRPLGKMDQLVLQATDLVVFPSWFAAKKLVPNSEDAQVLQAKLFVQPFCKNFFTQSRLFHKDQVYSKLEALLEPKLTGLDIASNGAQLNFVSIARFDCVKGLESLIVDFAKAEFGVHRSRLFLLGRAEALCAKDLAQFAVGALGAGVRVACRNSNYFVEKQDGTRQVFIFDEYFNELIEFLSCCQFAVISSLGSEVICRTAVEYLQVGLPVISTDVGSLKETLGHAAIFYAKKDSGGTHAANGIPKSFVSYSFTESFERAAEVFNSSDRFDLLCEAARVQGQKYVLAGFSNLARKVDQIASLRNLATSKNPEPLP